MYPSDPIPPILYATVKPHKPEKNYSMCSVVSAIRTPFYGISKYLVKIIQPTLNKSQDRIKISAEFSNEAKHGKYPQLKFKDLMMSLTYIHLFFLKKLSMLSQSI